MISLSSIANLIQTGINANMPENMQIKVWTDVGKYEPAIRTLNTIEYIFPALLTSVSSTNSTTNGGLIMGLQSLVLELKIPQEMPRTTPEPTTDLDYSFVENIRSILDNYFAANKTTVIVDGTTTYKVGIAYGISESGNAEISSHFGGTFTFIVRLTLLYAENGINSRDVTVQFDNFPVQFETSLPSRSATVNTDVFSSSTIAKNIVTSTAFSFDFALPCTTDDISAEFINYLLTGTPNVVHFVKITWADVMSKTFLMTIKDAESNLSGVELAGLKMPLIEAMEAPEMLNYPSYFYIAVAYLTDESSEFSLTFPAGMYYFNGEIIEYSEEQTVTQTANTQNLVYNGTQYGLYIVSPSAVQITAGTNISLISVIQEGVANA